MSRWREASAGGARRVVAFLWRSEPLRMYMYMYMYVCMYVCMYVRREACGGVLVEERAAAQIEGGRYHHEGQEVSRERQLWRQP